jgi:hypothetical protein
MAKDKHDEPLIDGYPVDHYENDMPEEYDPHPERRYDADMQKWLATFSARLDARIEKLQARRMRKRGRP